MNIEKPKRDNTRASTDYTILWNGLNWTAIEKVVNKLQSRIAKAILGGRINHAKKLQYLLTKSFYARLIAVKRATSNKGKKTPGVDGEIWSTPGCKYKGALKLSNKGYKAQPLKRTFINKSNGKKRPLGIPTIYDRAMQALYLLSLDPVSETILDKTSFGSRRFRSCKDASEYLFKLLHQKTSAKWVLEGDIKGCFDNISHKWLQENVVMEKKILHQFLKSGYVYSNKLYPTVSGSPQGGVISPAYANLTLNGLGDMLRNRYWKSKKGSVHRRHNKNKVNITVYADDFIITANSKQQRNTCRNKYFDRRIP
ncbi:reverse transcriptase domain-containing protein [Natranaerovirga hydrolytica]|uniref:reverse transcriptase domain-containing protein n=1 Tax=Natranaerovirga hydrolytica TaxID=680378 RepID=UPI001FAAD656|nr:reverse transcriptase domain-containing protein [Natranaerovirga hydrolytica]